VNLFSNLSNMFGGGNNGNSGNNGGQPNGQQAANSGGNQGPQGASSIFTNAGNRPQGQQQQVNNAPGSSLENPGGVPGNQGQEGAGGQQGAQGQNSPLEEMAKLWETDPTKQGNTPSDPFAEPLFTMDPKKLRESSAQLDFTSQISPELMQKALSGDGQAMMQIINQTAQNAVATSLQMSTMLAEQTGAKLGQRFKSTLPNEMRRFQIDNTTPQTEILQNPAVSPMLKMIRERVAVNNPNMRPAEVNAKAEAYLLQMADALRQDRGNNNGGQTQNQGQTPAGVIDDFSTWG
jgi:hypothetical protein